MQFEQKNKPRAREQGGILSKIVTLKLQVDIHSSEEMIRQVMALKEHVKARYRLSDLIRAQKNDKRTS